MTTRVAPMAPSNDFLGLMVGASGRFPHQDPTMNAAVSYTNVSPITDRTKARPSEKSSMARAKPAMRGMYATPRTVTPDEATALVALAQTLPLSGRAVGDTMAPEATSNAAAAANLRW